MCLGGDVAAGGASRARRAASPPLFSRFKPVCGGVAGLHAQEVAEKRNYSTSSTVSFTAYIFILLAHNALPLWSTAERDSPP